jgi:cation diffusion facilitator family transporter
MTMHLGHSHSHHHHHGHDHADSGAVQPPMPTTRAGRFLRFVTRRTARIAFAAVAILGPALLRNRRLSRTDVGVFAATATTLALADSVRREVLRIVAKVRALREGMARHSTPLVDPREIFSKNDDDGSSSADRVTLLGVVVNLLLSVGKAIVGITCHSSALVADAGHSLSDLFSDFITLWAVQIGRLPPDDDHPYGHGKFEAMGSLFLAMTLLATGVGVGAASGQKLVEIVAAQRSGGMGATGALLARSVPTAPALAMAGLSILSKEWLYRITRKVGEALNSQVVIANAWHHRSDAYSSILALVSIGLAMSVPGLLAADAAAGILVAGMICMTGAEIFGESVKQLTDTNDEMLVGRVDDIVRGGVDGADIVDVNRIRARQVGSSAIVDVSITTNARLSSSATRGIEERLRWAIMGEPGVLDAEVHSTPAAGSAEVVCPLLAAEEAKGNLELPPSTASVELDVRRVLGENAAVLAVESVTVNYRDTMLVDVDATIRVDPASTVAKANKLAADLKFQLEKEGNIDKASIYLDLNEPAASVVTAAVAQ